MSKNKITLDYNPQTEMKFYPDVGPVGMWLRKDERLRWVEKEIPRQIEECGGHAEKLEKEAETLRSELNG